MPLRINKRQPPSHYFNKYHLPIFSEFVATAHSNFKKNSFNSDLKTKECPLFTTIEIETYNRCNNDCPFCPANRLVDKRLHSYMPDELFFDIIRQLKAIKYTGDINLFHNNEPFLDNRLPTFVEFTKLHLPDANVAIWTNGSLLTMERLEALHDAGFRDWIVIDNYSDNQKINPNVKSLLEEIPGTVIEKDFKIVVSLRDKNAVLNNRAGQAPNKNIRKLSKLDQRFVLKRWCSWPFRQFNVNPEGKVHICCNDVYYQNIVGDLTSESIMQVWEGEKLRKIRAELLKNGRRNISPCNQCDTTTSFF